MRQNMIMKRFVCILLFLSALFAFHGCSQSQKTITTVAELDGCTLTTVYAFDDDDKLVAVKQTALYSDSSAMAYDYSLIEAMMDSYFTDVEKDETTISLTLTEKGMTETYPDATYSSILETAEAAEVKIETSK